MKSCWGDVEAGTVRFCGDVAATASDFLLDSFLRLHLVLFSGFLVARSVRTATAANLVPGPQRRVSAQPSREEIHLTLLLHFLGT